MNNLTSTIWFVYDGDCPICNIAAQGFRIRKAVGKLQLINAREEAEHPVMQEVTAQGLNIDYGMVIKYGDAYYQGKNALHLMALIGSNQGWFNRMNALLFRPKIVASFTYPLMKEVRDLLLKAKKIPPINNLNKHSNQPIFKSIFGPSWNALPPVMHKHYANRPYSRDIIISEGVMDVSLPPIARLLSPLFRVFGTLVPYAANSIPVTVRFCSEEDSSAFRFDRQFLFPGKQPYYFRSRMVQIKGNDIIEFMRFGLGWRMHYLWDGKKVILQHQGYVLKLLGILIPLPLSWLVGKGYAEEEALSEDSFRMQMYLTHPLFGKIFEYKGVFTIHD